jgi:hypothetical protein
MCLFVCYVCTTCNLVLKHVLLFTRFPIFNGNGVVIIQQPIAFVLRQLLFFDLHMATVLFGCFGFGFGFGQRARGFAQYHNIVVVYQVFVFFLVGFVIVVSHRILFGFRLLFCF